MMHGRRVENVGALERAGDYCLTYRDGVIVSMWAKLPRTGTQGRIAAQGQGNEDEPEWAITEHDNGAVTVEPSIDEGNGGYHGHLNAGVWTEG